MTEFVGVLGGEGLFTLAVSGDVDIATVDEFLVAARTGMETAAAVELDLSGVTFIDSSGLGVLVRLRKEAAERGCTLRLTNVPAKVSRILGLTGLTNLFPELHPDS